MRQIIFLLEEPSAKEMLKGVLPKLIPETISIYYVVFQGKQDLEKRLPIKLRAWQYPDALFVVICDQDSGDCTAIKQNLVTKCAESGKPDTLVRIACRELESFYLGDLAAVSDAIGPANLAKHQSKAKFRNPDTLGNPSQELKKLAPLYQKVSGSRAIGPLLDLDRNQSPSFNALINGVRRLIGEAA